MFIWIFVHLNKSSFNFARLIFRSRHSFRSQRFCGSWLQSVSRFSKLVAVMPTLLAEIIHPMRLNARSQFAEAAKMEKMKIAVLTRNEGNVFRTSETFQKHRDQKKWVLCSATLSSEKSSFFGRSYQKASKNLFLNFDCSREKRCTRTFKRTFFEDRDAHVRSLIRHTFSMDFSKNCTTIISRACYNRIIHEMWKFHT